MSDETKGAASEAGKMLGQLGASKGGKARAEKLTPERRSEIARKAVQARWAKEPRTPTVSYGSEDHPLKLGGIEISCYVLDDGRRVLTQSGMLTGLGMSHGGGSRHTPNSGPDRLARFASGNALKPYMENRLRDLIQPVEFYMKNGLKALGYEATLLADICEAVLAARSDGVLQKQQMHIANQCEILVRGFARVGIIALVDEATGYQYFRERQSLEKILEEFISKELLKWAKMFPDEFYREMFRLRDWTYSPNTSKRTAHAANLTIDVVYERLAPGVLEELRNQTPRGQNGRLKHKLFQRLTEDVGHARLREHLATVIGLMKAFDTWEEFHARLDRALPKYGTTPMFPVMYASDDATA